MFERTLTMYGAANLACKKTLTLHGMSAWKQIEIWKQNDYVLSLYTGS